MRYSLQSKRAICLAASQVWSTIPNSPLTTGKSLDSTFQGSVKVIALPPFWHYERVESLNRQEAQVVYSMWSTVAGNRQAATSYAHSLSLCHRMFMDILTARVNVSRSAESAFTRLWSPIHGRRWNPAEVKPTCLNCLFWCLRQPLLSLCKLRVDGGCG